MAAQALFEKVSCAKCGEFIFSREKVPNEGYKETHSPLPVLFRVSNDGIQYICPVCGNVGAAATPERRIGRVSRIYVAPQIPDDRLKLRSAAVLNADKAIYQPTADALVRVTDAFYANIGRVVALGDVVALTSGLGVLEASIYQRANAIEDVGGPNPPPELVALSKEHADLYRSLSNHRLDAMKSGTGRISAWAHYHADVESGLEAIFSSQIVGAWTAIETLLADLWETSINSHPKGLGDLKGSPKRLSKRSSDASQKGDQGQAATRDWKVPLADIMKVTRGSYDLSNKVGTLLRDNFNFVRLEGIREAYSCAFFERSAKVDAALTQGALDAINIARNVLVHRAGKADQEYVGRSKSFTTLPKLSVGEQFPLNAEVRTRLISDAIESSVALTAAVDAWVSAN